MDIYIANCRLERDKLASKDQLVFGVSGFPSYSLGSSAAYIPLITLHCLRATLSPGILGPWSSAPALFHHPSLLSGHS